MKKFIFLILTLAIPVSIFLFLKIFGNNEFEVPVLFENGISECDDGIKPHVVPAIEFSGDREMALNSQSLDGFLIFGVLASEAQAQLDEEIIQLVRIQDAFYEIGAPTIILLSDQKDVMNIFQTQLKNAGLQLDNFHFGVPDQVAFNDFIKCGLGLTKSDTSSLVLVDPKKRIRGIYNALDLEQTEQLILELKILRKKE